MILLSQKQCCLLVLPDLEDVFGEPYLSLLFLPLQACQALWKRWSFPFNSVTSILFIWSRHLAAVMKTRCKYDILYLALYCTDCFDTQYNWSKRWLSFGCTVLAHIQACACCDEHKKLIRKNSCIKNKSLCHFLALWSPLARPSCFATKQHFPPPSSWLPSFTYQSGIWAWECLLALFSCFSVNTTYSAS